MAKPHGEAHLSNTAQGKRWLFKYDGHAREPGAMKERKQARWRRRRRKEHQSIEQMRADIEALGTARRLKARYDGVDLEA